MCGPVGPESSHTGSGRRGQDDPQPAPRGQLTAAGGCRVEEAGRPPAVHAARGARVVGAQTRSVRTWTCITPPTTHLQAGPSLSPGRGRGWEGSPALGSPGCAFLPAPPPWSTQHMELSRAGLMYTGGRAGLGPEQGGHADPGPSPPLPLLQASLSGGAGKGPVLGSSWRSARHSRSRFGETDRQLVSLGSLPGAGARSPPSGCPSRLPPCRRPR